MKIETKKYRHPETNDVCNAEAWQAKHLLEIGYELVSEDVEQSEDAEPKDVEPKDAEQSEDTEQSEEVIEPVKSNKDNDLTNVMP